MSDIDKFLAGIKKSVSTETTAGDSKKTEVVKTKVTPATNNIAGNAVQKIPTFCFHEKSNVCVTKGKCGGTCPF